MQKRGGSLPRLEASLIAFAFPSAFTEWGGVKLTALVVPAIQVIMWREIMLYYLANG